MRNFCKNTHFYTFLWVFVKNMCPFKSLYQMSEMCTFREKMRVFSLFWEKMRKCEKFVFYKFIKINNFMHVFSYRFRRHLFKKCENMHFLRNFVKKCVFLKFRKKKYFFRKMKKCEKTRKSSKSAKNGCFCTFWRFFAQKCRSPGVLFWIWILKLFLLFSNIP